MADINTFYYSNPAAALGETCFGAEPLALQRVAGDCNDSLNGQRKSTEALEKCNILEVQHFPRPNLAGDHRVFRSEIDSSKKTSGYEAVPGSSKEPVKQEASDRNSFCNPVAALAETCFGREPLYLQRAAVDCVDALNGQRKSTELQNQCNNIFERKPFVTTNVTKNNDVFRSKAEADCPLKKSLADEAVPGSSKEPVKQAATDRDPFWVPSSIKLEMEDNGVKASEAKGEENSDDETGEEVKEESDVETDEEVKEESDIEEDEHSDDGAYHLAEVSYGEEDDVENTTKKRRGTGPESILGLSHDISKAPNPRLETIDVKSSNTSERPLASDFIVRRKNVKVRGPDGKILYRNFECSLCGYKAPARSSLLDHIHKHTGDRIHHCLHCNKKFRYKSYLIQHITVYHTDRAQFSCKLCDCKFMKESEFTRHLRTHSNERPFPCNFCDYSARNKGTLKEHLRTHTGEKPYECEQCSYKCAYLTLLKRHIATQHEKKTYACDLCDYKGNLLRNLKQHSKVHMSDKGKLFYCDQCNYKSHKKDTLKGHINNIHSTETMYTCAICDGKFKQKKSLTRHIHKHMKKNTYECKKCNAFFDQIQEYLYHNTKWHPDDAIALIRKLS